MSLLVWRILEKCLCSKFVVDIVRHFIIGTTRLLLILPVIWTWNLIIYYLLPTLYSYFQEKKYLYTHSNNVLVFLQKKSISPYNLILHLYLSYKQTIKILHILDLPKINMKIQILIIGLDMEITIIVNGGSGCMRNWSWMPMLRI